MGAKLISNRLLYKMCTYLYYGLPSQPLQMEMLSNAHVSNSICFGFKASYLGYDCSNKIRHRIEVAVYFMLMYSVYINS